MHIYNTVEYAAVVQSVRLWDCGRGYSLWVHPSAVINIMLGSGDINITIQTPDGEVVLFNVSQFGSFLRWKIVC